MGFIKRLVRKLKSITKSSYFLFRVANKTISFINSLFRPKANICLYNKLTDLTNNLGDYKGCSYFNKCDINIAIITDEFMYNYYKDAVSLIYVTPQNYIDIIDNEKIDYVMFVSCWKGLGEKQEWRGKETRNKVIDVFEYASKKGIESIFQTIEDPSNYNEYLHIAKVSDFIFTSAVECIENYKKDTGNDNVYLLEYGINPALHNPIGCFNKYRNPRIQEIGNSVFFAGTWTDRYRERCQDLKILFDGVIASKDELVIADRNLYIKGYDFPRAYGKSIIPPIEHKQLQKAHKLFKYNINVNSIKYSMTMCAMRVYEMQALGGLIVSNYSLAVSNRFPNIFIAHTKEYIAEVINGYKKEQLMKMQALSIRNVFSNSTVYDRLNYIFQNVNSSVRFEIKKVFVICDEVSSDVLEMVNKQTYEHIEILSVKDAKANLQKNGYALIYDKKREYSRHYIEDMVNAFKYTDVCFVEFNDNNAYEYVEHNQDIYASLYDLEKVTIEGINSSIKNGFAIYNSDTANLQSKNETNNKLGVIIPVYNNGVYLRGRCFNSLVRSSIFDKMAIYIIDDGSTDQETLQIIEELDSQHSNVQTYYFHDGGSGSASRSRNKGVELCVENYVTYLDPDNEAINDGYAELLQKIEENDVDMAFGTIVKIKDNVKPLRYCSKDCLIENPKEDLLKSSFRTQSIQACVIRRALIVKNQIKNPIGALGQDTLFFHELMLNAKKAYHTTLPIHLYYAQRGTSTLNEIGISFFEKFQKLEEYQVKVYKKYGVLKNYIDTKLDYFMKNWYEEKLKHVHDENLENCQRIVNEIRSLYIGD